MLRLFRDGGTIYKEENSTQRSVPEFSGNTCLCRAHKDITTYYSPINMGVHRMLLGFSFRVVCLEALSPEVTVRAPPLP